VSGRLAGKRAIVTGAGRGIGRAIARAMASEGAEVLLLGRTKAPLQETAGLIEAAGGGAWVLACDIRDDDQVEACVLAAVDRWGGIDILANNAGIDDDTPFLDVDRGRWRDIIATNLTAPFITSQAVARVMRETGGGAIVHNASIDASGGDGPFAAYNASKAGLLGLNRTMALELAPHGIRSNCVSPGFTHTEMTESAVGPALMEFLQSSFARVPMRRLVRPEEVAAAFVFLASDEASAITGTELRVDCGLTANWYILETLPTTEPDTPRGPADGTPAQPAT
jgi:NAD(P)-dependent dehydrogenase (short-subunit alcohol dehydrogenase family)